MAKRAKPSAVASGDPSATSIRNAAEFDERSVPAGPREITKRFAFEALYSKWLAARAIVEDPTQPDDDKAAAERHQAHELAERQLMITPAWVPWAIWIKWQVLELSLDDDYRDGTRNDARTVIALASIKADLMSFGFGV